MKKYQTLPVYGARDRILEALEKNPVIVVESPTGSGKTIGIPIILYENGYLGARKIAVTQPRRIAALNVCSFIKDQLDITDDQVACKIRFYDESTSATRIKIMTDGILLEEMKADPMLQGYSVIMIDEAHERSMNIDFLLGLLKGLLEKRDDLKVIISSATMNTGLFSDYFCGAPIVSIEGESYPVDVIWSPLEEGLPAMERDEALIERISGIVRESVSSRPGGILVFLPGESLIKKTCSKLNLDLRDRDAIIYPLFSRLSREDQLKVFIPPKEGQAKIVVATNIAETSITIDGIRTVIDSGLVKINYYNQENCSQSLVEKKITKSNALQRQGRAGRVCSGVCYRIYSEKDFDSMPLYPEPEIGNSDLSEVVLRMLDLGITDIEGFPFISRVGRRSILSALKTLRSLEAIEADRSLTGIGRFMASFPLPVRPARVLAEAVFSYPGTIENITTILAFLSTKPPLLRSEDDASLSRRRHESFASELGDYVSYLQIYDQYESFGSDRQAQDKWCDDMYLDKTVMLEVASIKRQLSEMLSAKGIPLMNDCSEKEYLLCVMSGMRQFICKKTGQKDYSSPSLSRIRISSSSLYRPRGQLAPYIIASEIVRTSQTYAHVVSPVLESWVRPFGFTFPSAIRDDRFSSKRGKRERAPDKASPIAKRKAKARALSKRAGAKKAKPERRRRAHSLCKKR